MPLGLSKILGKTLISDASIQDLKRSESYPISYQLVDEGTQWAKTKLVESSLQAGSSVENGARSKYKGLITSRRRKSLQRSL